MRLLITALYMVAVSYVCSSQVPGVVIDHQAPATRQYIGSPSIVILANGDYVASHDLFGPGSSSTTSAETKVFSSHDRGKTWKQTTTLKYQFWSNLFVQAGRLYLMGTSAEYGRITIRNSEDNGATWSQVHYLTQDAGYHTSSMPMVIREGRIYRAFEFHPAGPWGSFRAFMMWAPADSDLTDAKNWNFSERLSFPDDAEGNTWLEGNAVLGPDGSILDVLRVDNLERAAILRLDGNRLVPQRFVELPGGSKKFSIRFDPVSKLYWTLANPALPGQDLSVSSPGSVRNTLALFSSPDLEHWSARKIVLNNPDARLHGFQYVDWQFDSNDLIAASRTAFDDAEGSAHSYHDANFLTFHRIGDFRSLGNVALAGESFTSAEVVSGEQMQNWTAQTHTRAARNPDGVASQRIGSYGTHTTTLTTRTATGTAEQHRDWCDIFVIVSGEADLLSGGKLVDAHTVADGEIRGTAITGGRSEHLSPGSVAHIDPQVPHQLRIPPNASLTYFVVKAIAEKSK